MTAFSHAEFQLHPFEDVPLNEDVFLMDERWMPEYEAAQIQNFNGGEYPSVGYISYAAVRSIGVDSLEISWYPNIYDRFHEVLVTLPRQAFINCVDTPRWDGNPRIFVKSSWLAGLYSRPFSAFALIDAIGVKNALAKGRLEGPSLVRLRDRIDVIAAANPAVAFVSFADSILLKANWTVGQYHDDIVYSYNPEAIIRMLPTIATAYREELSLDTYATVAQGYNLYDDSDLLHLAGNHLSLNSLGLPFAQVMAIEGAARTAIRAGTHAPSELYLDENFYHSLRFDSNRGKPALPKAAYTSRMGGGVCFYFYSDRETVLRNLDPVPPEPRKKRRNASE
jgi:hypothetical protein